MKNKRYECFVRSGNEYHPSSRSRVLKRLTPGFYELKSDERSEAIWFEKTKFNHDNIVDLPTVEYDTVLKELELFLLPEIQKEFKKHGFVYKRSSLLFGKAGTGKTILVNRIAKLVVDSGGVVLFNPDALDLKKAFKVLDAIQPDTKLMVIFEELDEILKYSESHLLSILDGEIQKDNVVYMATTNHIDAIPSRIMRPGRYSTVMEVKYPDLESRKFFLQRKLGDIPEIKEWADKTHGFSIDELKETVLSVLCLKQPLDKIIKRIAENKSRSDYADSRKSIKKFSF